jgi:hypothetical protein
MFGLAIAVAMVTGSWMASHGFLVAQEASQPSRSSSARGSNIADTLLQPVKLPFGKETSLEDVVKYLRNETKSNVVLDLAALKRQKLTPDFVVQLDLDGVRLKTGLKLLLDQAGLTFKVVGEDNLLIITDRVELQEPLERVLDELKELHRDVHVVQDEIRQIRDMISLPMDEEAIPKTKIPTIIEEVPADAEGHKAQPKGKPEKSKNARPGI